MRRRIALSAAAIIVTLLLVLPAAAQDLRGPIEIGVRTFWGDVYGRPDLSFKPELVNSKFNEYGDIRKNLYLRRANVHLDDIFGSHTYFSYRTQSSLYKNQSHLATLGQYGRYRVQFRFTEIPHTFSSTSQTIYSETQPGVYTIAPALRQALQTAASTGTSAQINSTLPAIVATQLAANLKPFVPKLLRRSGGGSFSYDLNPEWNLLLAYNREQQRARGRSA